MKKKKNKNKKGASSVVKLWILDFLLGCFTDRINSVDNYVGKIITSSLFYFVLIFCFIL
jgi:hypothetical protein